MLYTVIWAIITFVFGAISINLFVAASRIFRGSDSAFEMNRRVSKGILETMFGETSGTEVDGEVRANCGIAYTEGKNEVIFRPQSKLSHESLNETSVS